MRMAAISELIEREWKNAFYSSYDAAKVKFVSILQDFACGSLTLAVMAEIAIPLLP